MKPYIFLENDEMVVKTPSYESSELNSRAPGRWITNLSHTICFQIVFYQNPKFEDSGLKNRGKTDRRTRVIILWAIRKNWTRVHQYPWNLAIRFIIQYHKTRIYFVLAKKKLCRFYEFLNNFGLAQKNRKITLLAVNNAFFNRFSWLSIFFEVNLVIFWFLCILRILVNFRFFTDYFISDLWPSKWMRYWSILTFSKKMEVGNYF
jgi:hypothetical protein